MKKLEARAPAPEQADGRRRRADVSRARIVAAMMDLIRAGDPTPRAEAVAAEAGVGLRTVFRLYNDMDSLYGEMHVQVMAHVAPLLAPPLPKGPWRAQLATLLRRRAQVYEEMLAPKTAADAQRARSPFLQQSHANLVRVQREALLAVVPAGARRGKTTADALDVAASFETWRRLRYDQELAPAAAEAVMMRLVDALLPPAP